MNLYPHKKPGRLHLPVTPALKVWDRRMPGAHWLVRNLVWRQKAEIHVQLWLPHCTDRSIHSHTRVYYTHIHKKIHH